MNIKANRFDLTPTLLFVEAMRDNGYKNAAHAVAELMDNSIQAGANVVELLCAERETQLEARKRRRIEQIAILDNGCGMDSDTLRLALQFGNGTRLVSGKQSGIGRFGMGLPASSISQCTRVDVWTWQSGPESAIHTCLDLDAIRKNRETSVPKPKKLAIPKMWRDVSKDFGKTGTLVVWSNLDRLMWKTASALIENSDLIIGRLYRRFLDKNKIRLRVSAFNIEDPTEFSIDRGVLPNDPGYLIERTSCPAPYDDTPMFDPWSGEHFERTFTLNFRGKKHEVTVRLSCAKPDARSAPIPGSTDHGRHAGKNVGVSVVRAERELELDQGLVIAYDPRERWWGVEVSFPPSLDELFGVANNKQSARNFAEMTRMDVEAMLKGGRTLNSLKAELTEDEDPRAPFIEIVTAIDTQIGQMRRVIKAATAGKRSKKEDGRYEVPQAEQTATDRTRERITEGHVGASDKDENLPAATRAEQIETALVDIGVEQQEAEGIAATTVEIGLKYVFAKSELDTDAFFSVRPKGGAMFITLNTDHPAYDNLVEVLDQSTEGASEEDLAERLNNAASGLRLLLMAWARYEDELPDGSKRKRDAQETRNDWGRIARAFLSQSE